MSKLHLQAMVTAAVLALGASAHAAGFAVFTQGARATAMAEAVTAGIDDASSAFYNPAGLAQIHGLDIQLGDTLVIPQISAATQAPLPSIDTTTLAVPVLPPQGYLGYKITKHAALGVGVFLPFGLAVHWPKDWIGQSLITDAKLSALNINPEVAYQIGKVVRLGAGMQVVRSTVTLENRPTLPLPGSPQADLSVTGSGWGVGANGGVQVEVLPNRVLLGASYRSPVRLDITGNANFGGLPSPIAGALNQGISSTVKLPQVAQAGVAVKPLSSLWVEADVEYIGWQSIHDLRLNFAQPTTPDVVLLKDWKHTYNAHVGAEYGLTDNWRVRAGVLYDPTPSPTTTLTPDIPDANRLNLAAGIGYRASVLTADLGYQHIIFMNRTTTGNDPFPATYSGAANLVGLTLGAVL